VEWARYIPVGMGVRFRVTCRKSRLYHSDAVTQRLAAAVEYAVGAKLLESPVNEDDEAAAAGQPFIVRMANDVCTISADSSGVLLHRRGYRQAIAKAPLRETLAAAMIIGCDWDTSTSLVDPMCGSGTIPIEAAMIARRMAPGRDRTFAFERWPEHDSVAWRQMADEARAQELEHAPAAIIASDRDAGAVRAATENAIRAGVAGDIEISERAVSDRHESAVRASGRGVRPAEKSLFTARTHSPRACERVSSRAALGRPCPRGSAQARSARGVQDDERRHSLGGRE
jgi:putative N6-adenine-specific DNA methylase